MSYRPHPAPMEAMFGYDPVQVLPANHLARFIDSIVQEAVQPAPGGNYRGQPQFDPRLLAKVLLYGYSTGIRSSRQLERHCSESLPYLYLTRGDTPGYRTLCTFRVEQRELIEQAWNALFDVAGQAGLNRLGRITIDSTKIRADAASEATVAEKEFESCKSELERILKEAEEIDASEDNQAPGQTQLERTVSTDQMRDILRRLRKRRAQERKPKSDNPEPVSPAIEIPVGKALSPRMRKRIEAGVAAIEAAQKEGRKHVCLTDPDARMMGEGRDKRLHQCHTFEAAVDNELLVVGQNGNSPTDNDRMIPIVEAARAQEPEGLSAVDADSGYFAGAAVAALIEEGLDLCVPDSNTACDLHRDQPIGTTLARTSGSVAFDYNEEKDIYTCPEKNVLRFRRAQSERGQDYREYRAERSCNGCPLRAQCGRKSQGNFRTLRTSAIKAGIAQHLDRFSEEQHRKRYKQRGPAVETVFGFMRAVLNYDRWKLRGSDRIAAEATIFKAAYQIRKVHQRIKAMA